MVTDPVRLYEHLVQVPAPATDGSKSLPPVRPDLGCELRSEALPPKAHRLVADLDAALVEGVFDIPQEQREGTVSITAKPMISELDFELAEGTQLGHPGRLGVAPSALSRLRLTDPYKVVDGRSRQRDRLR